MKHARLDPEELGCLRRELSLSRGIAVGARDRHDAVEHRARGRAVLESAEDLREILLLEVALHDFLYLVARGAEMTTEFGERVLLGLREAIRRNDLHEGIAPALHVLFRGHIR